MKYRNKFSFRTYRISASNSSNARGLGGFDLCFWVAINIDLFVETCGLQRCILAVVTIMICPCIVVNGCLYNPLKRPPSFFGGAILVSLSK